MANKQFEPLDPSFTVIPADDSNYGGSFTPRAIVLHTPEEEVDDREKTPAWFANPAANVSMHFYVSGPEGNIVQMVPAQVRAWGHGVLPQHRRDGYVPSWAWSPQEGSPTRVVSNYNAVAFGIEIEGRATSIQQTLTRGGAQWQALVDLIAFLCLEYDILPTRQFIVGHSELSSQKWDPGFSSELWAALMADLADHPLIRRLPNVPTPPGDQEPGEMSLHAIAGQLEFLARQLRGRS